MAQQRTVVNRQTVDLSGELIVDDEATIARLLAQQ